jgi:hypothetical protein
MSEPDAVVPKAIRSEDMMVPGFNCKLGDIHIDDDYVWELVKVHCRTFLLRFDRECNRILQERGVDFPLRDILTRTHLARVDGDLACWLYFVLDGRPVLKGRVLFNGTVVIERIPE